MAYILENLEMSKLTYILGHFFYHCQKRAVSEWSDSGTSAGGSGTCLLLF
jgi:hypothetical protein